MPALLKSRSTRPKASATVSNRPSTCVGLGDVAGDRQRLGVRRSGLRRPRRRAPACGGPQNTVFQPALSKRGGDRLADAGAGAGDDRGLSVGHGLSPGRSLSRGDFRSGSAWQAPGVKKGGHWRPPNKDRMGGGDRPECLQDAPCSLTKAERGPAGPGKSLFLFVQRPRWRPPRAAASAIWRWRSAAPARSAALRCRRRRRSRCLPRKAASPGRPAVSGRRQPRQSEASPAARPCTTETRSSKTKHSPCHRLSRSAVSAR